MVPGFAKQFKIELTVHPDHMTRDYTPRRIVSLQPSATVILHAIGALDRLVACTKYCADVCPEAASAAAIVDDSWTAKQEQIASTNPDLVIAAVPYQEKAVVEILKAGARFLGLAPRSLVDIYVDIATIAGTMGLADRGAQVIASMQAEIDRVHLQTVHLPRPSVFCEEWGKPLIASQPWVGELVHAAGGEFVGTPGQQCDFATVRDKDPEVLIAAWCGAGDRVPLEKIIRDRGWSEMKAVRERRVFAIRDEFLNTPAPTLTSGLHALAAAIHPEIFGIVPSLRQISDVSPKSHTARVTVV
jgi:iron complex transport system substrate-binding protein